MTMVEAVILLGFGVPIAAAWYGLLLVMASPSQNEENAKLAAQHK